MIENRSRNEPCTRTKYTFDDNGNLATKTDAEGTTTYTWDYENRLTRVTLPGGSQVNFKYDPLGRRIQKSTSSSTVNYVYDGANILEEIDTVGSLVARFTNSERVDEPLASLRNGTTLYYEADAIGSISSLSNGSGSLASTYVYDSAGKLTSSTGTFVNPYRFSGREYDTETGLYYYRARYYEPALGRFISEDPVGLFGGANLFAYVANSPVNHVDPKGQYITPAPNSTPQDVIELGRALAYLLRDSEMAKIIYQIATDPENEIVIDMHFPWEWGGDQTFNNTIWWDPHRASTCKSGGFQTPAMQLGHELAHHVSPVPKARDRQYGNKEEKRVIEGPEHHACRTLHECVRFDHDYTPSPIVPTSTSMPQDNRL
jgi:RHS repeat-associated protein